MQGPWRGGQHPGVPGPAAAHTAGEQSVPGLCWVQEPGAQIQPAPERALRRKHPGWGRCLGRGRLRPARRWQPGSLCGVSHFRSKGVPRKRPCWARRAIARRRLDCVLLEPLSLPLCSSASVVQMELWARAFNRINSLCKKKLLRGYCPLKSAHKGLQQAREEITADLQLVSFCEGSIQAWRFTLSFSRCHLMKFYKLSGSR